MYAAATGCRRVVKISAGGKVETVLKAEPPWSPTGVALHGDAIFVLEYPNTNGAKHADWVPRVRKVGRDGTTTSLAGFPKTDPLRQPRPTAAGWVCGPERAVGSFRRRARRRAARSAG